MLGGQTARRTLKAILANGLEGTLCAARVRYGYRRVQVLLRREGWALNPQKDTQDLAKEALGRPVAQ